MFVVQRAATVARIEADQDYPFLLSILFDIIRLVASTRPSQSRTIKSIHTNASFLAVGSVFVHLRLQLHRFLNER